MSCRELQRQRLPEQIRGKQKNAHRWGRDQLLQPLIVVKVTSFSSILQGASSV